MDQPLAIREIKRFITENEPPPGQAPPLREGAARVAVIGGGPCGLSAATFLAEAGHPVTVFEARAASGGMVSGTIPDYRAASHAIGHDLDRVLDLGVEIRHNQEVGKGISLASLRSEGFAYIVVAVGARQGLSLGIPGEDNAGVLDGLDFLRAARSGQPPTLGRRIGVVGGGDVAMDCARTARRLSEGEVTVFYRRTRAQMPAQKEEVDDLLLEGTVLNELVSPVRILTTDDRLSSVEFARMRLGHPDDSGRRRPEEIPGEVIEAPLDTLIVAIGQQPDLGLFGDQEVALTSAGYLAVDPETLETSLPGVYAGGDIIGQGPDSIVKACGDGRVIANAIHARDGATKLSSGSSEAPPWPLFDMVDLLRRRSQRVPRVEIPHLAPEDRISFAEVVQTLSEEAAMEEASRCVDCDLVCSTCVGVCPNLAILTYRTRPANLRIPQFSTAAAELRARPPVDMQIAQGPQVAVLTDACNECGNCVTFCPTAGRPWRDKPRLFMDRTDFAGEDENAFMFFTHRGNRGVHARFAGELHELIIHDGILHYASPSVRLALAVETLAVREASPGPAPDSGEPVVPARLGAMVTLLRSFTESLPEFPLVEADSEWILGG
ncbi:MAG: FAD-dependent oxidoreductase, partial [Thermoanaerobaculales bacterium]